MDISSRTDSDEADEQYDGARDQHHHTLQKSTFADGRG